MAHTEKRWIVPHNDMGYISPVKDSSKTIAHISDLHIGASKRHLAAAIELRDALYANAIDDVIVTGDVTHTGRVAEYEQFKTVFGSFIESGKLTLVPGNHDRLKDDVGQHMMDGVRVDVRRHDGVHVVRVDSTGPHNRSVFMGHGKIDEQIIAAAVTAAEQALPNDLVVVALHHHLLPLPEEMFVEKVATWLGMRAAEELRHGNHLLARLRGKCDIILHGHRHVPMSANFPDSQREFSIYNAGSSTELRRFRLFKHNNGRLTGAPEWMKADH